MSYCKRFEYKYGDRAFTAVQNVINYQNIVETQKGIGLEYILRKHCYTYISFFRVFVFKNEPETGHLNYYITLYVQLYTK
jgi:hypothetical protein